MHGLIVELARYERAEQRMALTVETLQSDMAQGRFECFVAEASGQIVGMALHHARYSTWKGLTWYLEDLVVTEPWRGQGVGRSLFLAVAAHAVGERQAPGVASVGLERTGDRLLQNVGGVVDGHLAQRPIDRRRFGDVALAVQLCSAWLSTSHVPPTSLAAPR